MSKKTASKKTTDSSPEARFNTSFPRASRIAGDHIDARVLDFGKLLELNSPAYAQLVSSINPRVTPSRGAAIESKLMKLIPESAQDTFEKYRDYLASEVCAEQEAAYMIGLSIGMRLAGGAR
jgi:hypothetical protein